MILRSIYDKSVKNNRSFLSLALIIILIFSSYGMVVITQDRSYAQTIPQIDKSLSHRSPRPTNTDSEPNDDFSSASIIEYDESGTTHIFSASVGGGFDVCDFWRLDVDNGTDNYTGGKLVGADDPDRLTIILSLNGTSSPGTGPWMEVYDSEKHKIAYTQVATEANPAIFKIIPQVNPYLYLKIVSNPSTNNFKYILSIINITEPVNPMFSNDEIFDYARFVNITKGKTFNNQDLTYIADCADFYTFYAYKDQKIKIDMTVASASQHDFDLYLFAAKDAASWVAESTTKTANEQIIYYSPSNRTYYLRVAVKNEGVNIPTNPGQYSLTFEGNVPPKWNKSFPDKFVMDEDGPPYFIDIQQAFYELNPGNMIDISFGKISGDDWKIEGGEISLPNATIKLLANQSVRIIPKPDKFGVEHFYVRATDNASENYTIRDMTIMINPVNDAPILNGTDKWIFDPQLIPGDGGASITGVEGNIFECTVTAYDPLDPGDSITYEDNTDMFEINPDTGEISFRPTYHYTGSTVVEITVRDDGTPPAETMREFEFIIEGDDLDHPETKLESPRNKGIEFTLRPTFKWTQVREDFLDMEINYDLYLSTNKDLVGNRDKSTLNASYYNNTEETVVHQLDTDLKDLTRYYWTVIPNDGLHMGECKSGVFSFDVNINIKQPKIKLISPQMNQSLHTASVTLRWDIIYTGTDPVKYDLYFTTSLEEMVDPILEPMPDGEGITERSYEVDKLPFERFYFWRVVPFTDKVRAIDSDIWIFHITENVPKITEPRPANNSILLPVNSLKLGWKINYTQPAKVSCELFWGNSPEFDLENGILIENIKGDERSYIISGLKKDRYYWKVVPWSDGLRGTESKIWTFAIEEDIDVPKTVLIEPVNTTLYTAEVILRWIVFFKDDFDNSKISYDIRLDNSTGNLTEMKIIQSNYKQTFYSPMIVFEEDLTYYWHVTPHVELDDGSKITGICSSGVVSFVFGVQGKVFNFTSELDTNTVTIRPGTKHDVGFTLENLGNQQTTIEIFIDSDTEITDNIQLQLNIKTLTLEVGASEKLTITIIALTNAEVKKYNVTIKAVALESTVVKDEDTLLVDVVGEEDEKDVSEVNQFLWLGIMLVIVIIILISLFGYSTLKRHRLLEHKRRELIVNYVKEHPGDHFRSIQRALELEVGVISHHINKLEGEKFIKSRQDGQYRRFYPIDANINVKLILSQIQDNILNWIKTHPGISGSTIATQLGMDRKLITYHLTVLQNAGIIYTEIDGREKLCYMAQAN